MNTTQTVTIDASKSQVIFQLEGVEALVSVDYSAVDSNSLLRNKSAYSEIEEILVSLVADYDNPLDVTNQFKERVLEKACSFIATGNFLGPNSSGKSLVQKGNALMAFYALTRWVKFLHMYPSGSLD